MCNFFVVPENGQALLGITDIEILNYLTIKYSSIDTDKVDKDTYKLQYKHTSYQKCRKWVALCKQKARNWQARKKLYEHKQQFKLLHKHRHLFK